MSYHLVLYLATCAVVNSDIFILMTGNNGGQGGVATDLINLSANRSV